MRHNKSGRKLGRNATHKKAMMKNMATSLFRYGSIRTTLSKAKEVRPYAERLITRAIDASLSDKRLIISKLADRSVAHHLINEVAPLLENRKGGYLRIIKLGPRQGDGAEMAIIEIVSEEVKKQERKRHKREKKETPEKAKEKSESKDSEVPEDHNKIHPRDEQTKEHLTSGSKAEGSRKSSKPPKRSVPKQISVNRGTSTPKTPPPSSQEN